MADEDDDIAEVERARLSGLRSSEKATEKAAVATVAGVKAEIGEDIRKNAEEIGNNVRANSERVGDNMKAYLNRNIK